LSIVVDDVVEVERKGRSVEQRSTSARSKALARAGIDNMSAFSAKWRLSNADLPYFSSTAASLRCRMRTMKLPLPQAGSQSLQLRFIDHGAALRS